MLRVQIPLEVASFCSFLFQKQQLGWSLVRMYCSALSFSVFFMCVHLQACLHKGPEGHQRDKAVDHIPCMEVQYPPHTLHPAFHAYTCMAPIQLYTQLGLSSV